MNEIPLVLLIIFSAFSMNLTLQCALGIREIAESKSFDFFSTLIKLSVIFAAVVLLWLFFSKIITLLISGFFIFVLLFPVSYMAYEGLEFLVFNKILKRETAKEGTISFPGGITAAAVFICMNIANNFIQTAMLSFGFVLGTFLVFMIIGVIRRRAALEAVPRFLRGKPLVLISMGMLSLVFSTASLLLFRVIGAR